MILGGGLVGLELGIALAESGRSVTVAEMMPRTIASPPGGETSERMGQAGLAAGEPLVHGVAISEHLKTLPNMRVLTSTKALAITEKGLEAEREGTSVFLEADTVIYAVGQRPLSEQALALRTAAPEWYAVGDCVTPRNILQATQQAYQIARDVGRY